jgi:hypothetical protein
VSPASTVPRRSSAPPSHDADSSGSLSDRLLRSPSSWPPRGLWHSGSIERAQRHIDTIKKRGQGTEKPFGLAGPGIPGSTRDSLTAANRDSAGAERVTTSRSGYMQASGAAGSGGYGAGLGGIVARRGGPVLASRGKIHEGLAPNGDRLTRQPASMRVFDHRDRGARLTGPGQHERRRAADPRHLAGDPVNKRGLPDQSRPRVRATLPGPYGPSEKRKPGPKEPSRNNQA